MSKLTSGLLRGSKQSVFDAPEQVIEDINKDIRFDDDIDIDTDQALVKYVESKENKSTDERTESQVILDDLDIALNSTESVVPIIAPEGDPIIDANRERIEKQRMENVSQFPTQESEYETFTPEEDKVTRREPAKFEEFARLIDEGSEDAAFALLNEGDDTVSRPDFDEVITSHKQMTSLLGEEAGKLNFNFSGAKKTEFYERLNNEEKVPLGDVRSLAEYGKRFLALQEEAERNDLGQAFTDSMMYSFMHSLLEQRWRKEQRENDIKDGKPESEIAEKEESGTVAMNGHTGSLVESAFNIKNGDKMTQGVTGAITKEIVLRANDRLVAAGMPSLFEQRTINKDGKSLNIVELTEAGLDLAQKQEAMVPTLIPKAVVKVRFERKMNEEGTKVKWNKSQKKKRDKSLDYGDYAQAQKSITYQENIPFTSNGELFIRIEESLADPEAREIIDADFIGLVGLEMKDGTISRRDKNGTPWRFTPILDANNRPMLNTITDPTNERYGFKYEVELSLSDRARYRFYDNTAMWIQDTQDAIFYYDFMIGNDRIYLKQNIGNWHSGKFARSLLQTGRPYQINHKSPREVGMHKALILQRAGLEKDDNHKSLYVEELITKFDTAVVKWSEMYFNHLQEGKVGIPIKLLKEADGDWEYLTAVEEALRFDTYLKNPTNKPYETRFFTELDGTSNALAWSAVQAGNTLVSRLTGLLPKIEGDAEDTYYYTVETFAKEMFKALSSQYNGDEATRVKFKQLWEYLGVKNRSLAKKPLMIFVYGAGGDALKINFGAELEKFISDEGFQKLAKKDLGLTSKEEQEFIELSKRIMVKAIETNFPDLRAYTKAMAAITEYSLDHGLNPQFKNHAGHILHFGRLVSHVDKEKSFKASFKDEEGKLDRFNVDVLTRTHDPRALSVSASGKEVYKAVKSAAVMVTHSNDSENMNGGFIDSFEDLQKQGKQFYGAQIFDGLMTTTTQAEMSARHLNKWFKKINAEISNLDRFIAGMKKQAKEKGIKFDLSSQTILLYNPRTGKEDVKVNLMKLVEKLNKRYKDLQIEMAKEEARQFPIPRWNHHPSWYSN